MSEEIIGQWPTLPQYRVEIASLYDTDERAVVRLTAYGEQDVRQQIREFHPGWYIRRIERVPR